MPDWVVKFSDRLFTQCGISTAILFLIVIYLCYQLNAERKEREDDRAAWRQDNQWRVQTATAMSQTLSELDRGVKSLLDIKVVILQAVKSSLRNPRKSP